MATIKTTKIDLLLEALKDQNWHWGSELADKVSWRFGATIEVARKKGHQIQTDRVGQQFQYRLLKRN
jgi:hypothetical protein